jgi:long-chain acyl-CoA synthetase
MICVKAPVYGISQKKESRRETAPLDSYKQKEHLNYPEKTLTQMVEAMAEQYPEEPAYEFYGKKTSYRSFADRIHRAAKAFLAAGIRRDDAVTICMPNVPQALDCFYALNRIGAVANMVHPLSAEKEITFYLNISESRMILTMDMFTEKVERAVAEADHPVTVLVARMQEELPLHLAGLYTLKAGRQYLKFPNTDHAILWKKFLMSGEGRVLPEPVFDREHTSVILYSGGTSGTQKGICLSAPLLSCGQTHNLCLPAQFLPQGGAGN